MAILELTIPYPEDLLDSLNESPKEFETEARLLLAVKLHELGKVSTGRGAELAGLSLGEFLAALDRFGLSPMAVEPGELSPDTAPEPSGCNPLQRLATLNAPTADLEQMLAEVEAGRR